MAHRLSIPLITSAPQLVRLRALQARFVEACNEIAPVVRASRCWNRVALHHLVYKDIRKRYPELGSQMACNAIYSVCRAARLVYQGEGATRLPLDDDAGLPLIQFLGSAPVYFDRHTLSIKRGVLSLFTLDGRMKVSVDLPQSIEQHFQEFRLREIILTLDEGANLHFTFGDDADLAPRLQDLPGHLLVLSASEAADGELISLSGDRIRGAR